MIPVEDFSRALHDYVSSVLSGDIPSCKMVRWAVERHVDDIGKQGTKDFPFWFDIESANTVLTIMSLLKVPVGKFAGQQMRPFDFQTFILAMIFGWLKIEPIELYDEGGKPYEAYLRRFTEAYISLGRGNSKTPLASIIALIQVGFDRPFFAGAEVYLTATDKDETSKAFDFCEQLVKESKLDGFECYKDVIIYKEKNYIKRVAAAGGDSFEIQCVIRDELHAWHDKHRDFYSKLRTGLAKRPQPLAISITTAGDDQSVLQAAELNYARQVLDPSMKLNDDHLFVFVAEIDIAEIDPITGESVGHSDDLYDEKCWPKANPAMKYGLVNVDEIRRLVNKSKSGDKGAENEVRRYHLNSKTSSKIKVFTPERWAVGHSQLFEVDKNTPTAIAVDSGYRDDLYSIGEIAICGEIKVPGIDDKGKNVMLTKKVFAADCDAWIPEDGPRDITKGQWPSWIKNGIVRKCPGDEVRVSFVKDRLTEIFNTRNVFAVYADPSWGREILQWVEEEHGIKTVKFSQTCWQYNEPMTDFISANNEGRIAHNNPLLDWCADNLVAKKDTQKRMMPWKDKSADKIDPLVALIMAFAATMYEKPQKRKRSVYLDRGVVVM